MSATNDDTWTAKQLEKFESYPRQIRAKVVWLVPNIHLPQGGPWEVSAEFYQLAISLLDRLGLPDSHDVEAIDQLVISLQKLIEAKDAAVRTALANYKEDDEV